MSIGLSVMLQKALLLMDVFILVFPLMLLLFRDFEFKSEEIIWMLLNASTGLLVKQGDTYTRPRLAKTLGNDIIYLQLLYGTIPCFALAQSAKITPAPLFLIFRFFFF